jgi:hypothetical protein
MPKTRRPLDAVAAIVTHHGGDAGAYLQAVREDALAVRRDKTRRRQSAFWRWRQMMARCHDERHAAWPRYGGRGIYVALEWQDFETFYAAIGDPPRKGLSMDRIDNDGPYAPGNVRWATPKQQAANSRKAKPPVRVESVPGGGWRVVAKVDITLRSATRATALADALQAALDGA